MISGKYVGTFAEASHALPDGMLMNADYPFVLPAIREIRGNRMTIVGRGGVTATVRISKRSGREIAYLEQSSSFEQIYRRPPRKFKLLPFKDERSDAAGQMDAK